MQKLDKKAIFDAAWEMDRIAGDLDITTTKEPPMELLRTLKSHADDAAFLLGENIKRRSRK